MIKLILFDLWGTIIENGVRSPVKQVKDVLRLRIPFKDYVVRFERAFMTQEFDDLRQGFISVCKEFNIHYNDFLLNKLVGVWNKNWLLARPFPESFDVLKDLKNDFKLALVSNTDSSVIRVVEKFNLENYFDKLFFSYKLGLLKIDPEFFKIVMREFSVKPEEVVMIGDSIDSDMLTPSNLGLKTILVDRRQRRDYPVKVSNLKEVREIINRFE